VSGDYLWNRQWPPDREVARLEHLLGQFRHMNDRAAVWPLPKVPRRLSRSGLIVTSAAAAAVIVCCVLMWSLARGAGPAVQVTRVEGAPMIGSRAVVDRHDLGVGRWLVTDGQSRASLDVGDIGRVDVDPNTRLGLLKTEPGDYRLHLDRGTVHAVIWAPPGQFSVQTPSSVAVDLGCAYTLTVGDDGIGTVRVTTGWVGFEWQGREAFIPAGAVCITRPHLGPGTPHYEETSEAFRAAIDTIDLHDGSDGGRGGAVRAALDTVLRDAEPRDVVTLWHLLTRVDAGERPRVFDRLAALAPPPTGVTRAGIVGGDRQMLDAWWDALGLGTSAWWRVWKQPWRDDAGSR
jgi:hypothetical protein